MRTVHRAAVLDRGAEAYDADAVAAWADHDGEPTLDPGESETVLVAERDGTVVGLGRLDADPGSYPAVDDPDAEVTACYVRPDHDRSGVGSAVLAGLVSRARGAEHDRLVCTASANAVGFYRRAGWRPVRETTHETGGATLDVTVMTRTVRVGPG